MNDLTYQQKFYVQAGLGTILLLILWTEPMMDDVVCLMLIVGSVYFLLRAGESWLRWNAKESLKGRKD